MNFTDLPEKAKEQAYFALASKLGKTNSNHGFADAKKDASVVASAFIDLYCYNGGVDVGRPGSDV